MSVPYYRIKNWDKHFENNRTRTLIRMDWVPIPNRMDKAAYIRLVRHEDGAAHLGAWLAIVEIASRCDVRGTLIQDNLPLSPQDLAEISHLPAGSLRDAIERLCSPEIGWLECVEVTDIVTHPGIRQVGAGKPHEGAPSRARVPERKGTEGNGTERNRARENPNQPTAPEIETTIAGMKQRHAKKDGLGGMLLEQAVCVVLGTAVDPRATLAAIDARHQLGCEREWADQQPRFWPNLVRWVTEGRWMDPPPEEHIDEAMRLAIEEDRRRGLC